MLRFYLAATQFALGDVPAPTIPSAMLTPTIRAQEALGWRKGLEADDPSSVSLFDLIDRAAAMGIPYVGAASGQRLGADMPIELDESIDPDAFEKIRLKLDASGVTLLTYRAMRPPSDATGWRALMAFARKMGAESLIAESMPTDLDTVGALCAEYDIRLACAADDPNSILAACKNREPRIGACGDFSRWARAGLDPTKAIGALGPRLITVSARGPQWSKNTSAERMLAEIRAMRLNPTMFAFGCPTTAAPATDISLFDDNCTKLVHGLR